MKSKILQVSFTSCPSKRWESITAPRGFKHHQRFFVTRSLFSCLRVIWSTGMSRGKCGTICLERRCLRFAFCFIWQNVLSSWNTVDFKSLACALPVLVAVCSGGVYGHQHHHHWAVLQLLVHSGVDEWDPVWGVPVPVSSQNKRWEMQGEDCLQGSVHLARSLRFLLWKPAVLLWSCGCQVLDLCLICVV